MNSDSEIPRDSWTLGSLNRFESYFGGIVFVAGLAIRLALVHAFPVIHGVDSVARLVNNDKILLAHQLPLLQAVIYALAKLADGPLGVRYFMALAGATAGVGAYRLGTDFLGRPGGLAVGLLFATQPFVLLYSIVPYHEILMLAGLLFALHHFLNERWVTASAWLALACFSRYEAWIACPVLMAAFARNRGVNLREIARGGLLFGWAPLLWMLMQGGVSPDGTSALALSFSVEKFHRYLYIGYIGLTNTPAPVVVLALAGLWQVWRLQRWRERRFLLPGVFVGLFLVAVLFVAHGVRDQPDRYTTSREAHIPIVAGVFLAGIGLLRLPKYRGATLCISAAVGVAMAVWFVHRDTSEPRLTLSVQTARYLDSHVGPSEQAALLAKPLEPEVLARYLRDAQERGGEGELRRALKILEGVDNSPLDAQRVLVHSQLGRNRLHSFASFVWPAEFRRFARTVTAKSQAFQPGSMRWIAVWSDFEPANDTQRRLAMRVAGATPVEVLEIEGLAVRLYYLE